MRESNVETYSKRYRQLLFGISMMGFCVGLGFTFLSRLVVYILYGEIYYPAISALKILIWSTSFAMIGSSRGIWLVSERKYKYGKYFTIMGAVVNVILNSIMIPLYGIEGAAFATLISQIFVSLVAPLVFQDTREFTREYLKSFKEFPNLWSRVKNTIGRK